MKSKKNGDEDRKKSELFDSNSGGKGENGTNTKWGYEQKRQIQHHDQDTKSTSGSATFFILTELTS